MGEIPYASAPHIIGEQMNTLMQSGLGNAAAAINICVNDDDLSAEQIRLFPERANIFFHGRKSCTENRTTLMIQSWCKTQPDPAYVLSFHSKGVTHDLDSGYAKTVVNPWRNRMMRHCVEDWKTCVTDLETHEAVGCHWLANHGDDKTQNYFGGNFFWVRSDFFATIPLLTERERIKMSGIDSWDSRYESEVVIGNGPRVPIVRDYYTGNIGT
jgi:hypothetical protein